MPTAQTILDDYERLRWSGNDPMSQMLALRRDEPGALAGLVIASLDRVLPHATFLDAALDLADDAAFAQVAAEAWRRVRDGAWNERLANVLSSVALHAPQVFSGAWDTLLDTVRTRRSPGLSLAENAWRALDPATVDAWRDRLAAASPLDDAARDRALALLHSRRPEAVLDAATRLFADDPARRANGLMAAGYTYEDGALRALHGDSPLHIDFGRTLRAPALRDMPKWKRELHAHHATWQAGDAHRSGARFGGVSTHRCGLCHEPLHRLLTLPRPADAGIDSTTPVSFATCLSCLGWESDGPLFYRHDEAGHACAHPSGQRDTALRPGYPAAAFVESDVGLFAAASRWAWQDWGDSNDRQNLSRVGGPPSWVQSAWYPDCPDCGRGMRFVMQIDSNLPQVDGGEWLWGSGGANYTFWCAPCRTSAHLWQCT
ncbi:hypothetical protein GQ57_03815 [Burkholderia sp. MSh2]|uniref:DUF1963 domain-containing protein n=1 Tax=Burkholderia paludis TaxID=1506587 RepID=A0A6J5EPT5_9BURK|nr:MULTISPECIES: hypothetical protein [Burkholderia]KEZ06909.1 hypothetical protein GQ57_03815 [Burkholderia sp. MSh2]CAB3768580.1 hypothetical protein LMG30113_05756 [Burkholderia paludis]VWC33944.1 hypothetical protein BPA30113_06461 [Burkholderia paludis]